MESQRDQAEDDPRTDAALDEVISEGLTDPEIRRHAEEAMLPMGFLAGRLREQKNELWAAGAQQFEQVRALDAQLGQARTREATLIPGRRRPLYVFVKAVAVLFLVFAGFLLLWVVGYLLYGAAALLPTGYLVAYRYTGALSEFVGGLIASLVSVAIFGGAHTGLERLAARFGPRPDRAALDAEIATLQARRADAWNTTRVAVMTEGVLGAAREVVNSFLVSSASHSVELPDVSATGLSELSSADYDIVTGTRRTLERTLDQMGSGAIGIAGPRGVGKTTLLRSLSVASPEPSGSSRVLALLATAPVEYVGRDFILHLFASVARQVLKLHGIADDQSPDAVIDELQARAMKSRRRVAQTVGLVAAVTGVVLLALSVTLALLAADYRAKVPTVPPPAAASSNPPSTSTMATTWTLVSKFGASFNIKPGPILMWGFILLVAGVAARLAFETETRPEQPESPLSKSGVADDIVDEARRLLTEVRYQQSYASGWTGSLKLPAAFESGLSAAVTLARTQSTLPDLVGRYRDFMTLAVNPGRDRPGYDRVIIGIDELDKLASDEQAYKFLNEIKAIFGLPKCFYLISVSESAISSFERRGINFRDAFDSAFDTMLYVDYLSLADSERLVRRRVIGLPRSFLCLGHCMAGGLPRDLIRACRDMLAAADDGGRRDMPAIVTLLMTRDLNRKLFAVGTAAKAVKLEPETSGLLERLLDLKGVSAQADVLLRECKALGVSLSRLARPRSAPADPTSEAEREKLRSIVAELAAYLYFLATILEFFGADVQESRLRHLDESGAVEALARAHQALGIRPRVAAALLSKLRKEHQLTSVEYPQEESSDAASV